MNDIYGGGMPPRTDVPLDPAQVRHHAEQRRDAFDRGSQFAPHISRWKRFLHRITGR